MSGAAGFVVLAVGSVAAAVAVVVRATELLRRRDRAELRERVARPVVDSARADAAVHGLHPASSDQLVAAVKADAAARDRRSGLVLHPVEDRVEVVRERGRAQPRGRGADPHPVEDDGCTTLR